MFKRNHKVHLGTVISKINAQKSASTAVKNFVVVTSYPELKVIHLEGNWIGPCQRESQNTDHEWLKVVFPDETALLFDPSYVQYLDEDWSWDGCKQAIKYCQLIKSHDPLFTDAFRSRCSEYPY